MISSRLFATKLLYKPISDVSFRNALVRFFEQQLPGYNEKVFSEKWELLKSAFLGAITESNTTKVVSEFMDKRLLSTNSQYVLSREKSLDYIERFYFLYTTKDPIFTLTHSAKESLLSLLRDAMTSSQLCETGRYVRFESIIMEFRADKNWIDEFFLKQRYLVITVMHELFGGDVHTLGVMQEIANEKGLGVRPMHQLSDVHMTSGRKQRIRSYFEEHCDEKFSEYENSAIKNLSQHLLFKLGELLRDNHIDISQWEEHSIKLPNGFRIKLIPDFSQFSLENVEKDTLYLYLQPIRFQGEQLYAITHHGEPFPVAEPLRNIDPNLHDKENLKADFEDIKQLLRDKKYSIADSFLEQLVISSLARRGGLTYLSISNALLSWISKYLKISDISEIKAVFCEEDSDADDWILKSKQACLAQLEKYIEKLLVDSKYFITSSQLCELDDIQPGDLILRGDVTLEMIKKVTQKLHESVDCSTTFLMTLNQAIVLEVILKHPFVLLRQVRDKAYLLADLPDIYKASPLVMDEVIQFFVVKMNVLLLEGNKPELEQLLVYLMSLIGRQINFLDFLPAPLYHHPWVESQLTQHKKLHQQIIHTVISILSTKPNVSLFEMVKLTQQITPWRFEEILQARRLEGLSPLPHCGDLRLYKQFCQELIHQLDTSHWTTYLDYKRQLISNAFGELAVEHFIATTSWFLAYMRYQHQHAYFNSRYDVQKHIIQIKMSLHKSFNVFIGFILPLTVLTVLTVTFVIPLFLASHDPKSFSEALSECSTKISADRNISYLADFMVGCGNALVYVNADAEEKFLAGCVKGLTKYSRPEELSYLIIRCTHILKNKGNGSFMGQLMSVSILVVVLAYIIERFKNNPIFPESNLSFRGELKRFVNRLQGSFSNNFAPSLVSDLLIRCSDLIIRLQGLDDPSAHQKAELLSQSLEEVRKGLPDTPTDQEVAGRLQEKIVVVQSHPMSFFTIAEQRRSLDTFMVTPEDTSFKTSSIKQLIAPPYTELFKLKETESTSTEGMKLAKLV